MEIVVEPHADDIPVLGDGHINGLVVNEAGLSEDILKFMFGQGEFRFHHFKHLMAVKDPFGPDLKVA